MNNKLIVGINHSGYNQHKNILSLKLNKYKLYKFIDICKLIDYLNFKIFKRNHECHNKHNDILNFIKPNLYHFFNTISYTKKPWIVTHESSLPRGGKNTEEALELLANDSCKQIIGFCKNAQKHLFNTLNKYPKYKDLIKRKSVVIYPSQEVIINSYEDKVFDNSITFTITGGDFFRKGGLEIIRVFDKLFEEGENVRLIIISALNYNTGWKDDHITIKDYKYVKKIISKHKKIVHYNGLPNSEVLEIYKNTHIGLLPSYGETFGYSILESQSCGAPVISTNMPPFEEINNNDIGWMIDVPMIQRDGVYTSDVYSDKGLLNFSKTLESGLYNIIKDILKDIRVIRVKGEKSIESVITNHNVKLQSQKIENIYDDILEKNT